MKVSDFKIGDCVLILLMPIPKVDRGPSDPVNIIAVIFKQNEHVLYKLGTKHDLIKTAQFNNRNTWHK